MTFEEAKKILEKEGFYVEKATRPCAISEAFTEYEDPSICKAMQVVSSAGYFVCMEMSCFDERKTRLKKELEEHANAPVSGKEKAKGDNPALKEAASQFNDALLDAQAKKIKSLVNDITHMDNVIYKKNLEIDKQNKEITRLLSLVEKKENSISRLYYEKSVLEKENEELKKGEIPARYFDKALVDEQEEKIKKLEHEKLDILVMASSCKQTIAEQGKKNKRLGKEIARLNKIIHKKNLKIEELRKEGSRHLRGKVKMFGETVDLSQELCDKNEELRLSTIREKNLTEVCQKYVKENEKLKKKLAEKIVDKIDAQALKSAESALAYKEKVIAEKDEVIADLGKELAAQKGLKDEISLKYIGVKRILKLGMDECEKLKKELEEKTKLVDIIRNASKEYCDYGVAANEFVKELASLYVLANNKGIINDEMLERCKNYQTYGFPANCNRETKKEINDIARGNENKKLSLFRDDSVGAVTNQKDCSSAKDTHPTEDKPEEVGLDEILECVRKALEKGHMVSIDYDKAEEGGDQSATIVQCDNGIILSKEEAEIIERCTKNGTELHYSEKDGFTYTNVFGDEIPIICLRGMCQVFTDEEIKNMKK